MTGQKNCRRIVGRQVQLQVRSENSLTGKEDAGFMEKPKLFLYALGLYLIMKICKTKTHTHTQTNANVSDIVHNCTLILNLSRDQFNSIGFLRTFPHSCIYMLYLFKRSNCQNNCLLVCRLCYQTIQKCYHQPLLSSPRLSTERLTNVLQLIGQFCKSSYTELQGKGRLDQSELKGKRTKLTTKK